MGKAYALTKKEILRIPAYLNSIYEEYKNTGSQIILYYWFIQLFEFVAILSVNTYKRPGAKKIVATYNTVKNYIISKTGVMENMSSSLTTFMISFGNLRHLFTHDINKYSEFNGKLESFMHTTNSRDFETLFTIIKMYDPEVSGIDLSLLEKDIKELYGEFNKKKKSSSAQALQQTAATSNSTLDAIANINKRYEI